MASHFLLQLRMLKKFSAHSGNLLPWVACLKIHIKTRIFDSYTCSMKTKLTLTVRKSVIATAKRYSRRTGKSISQMFEELFEKVELGSIKSEPQRAAARLLETLESSKSVKTLDDKLLLKEHVARKFS